MSEPLKRSLTQKMGSSIAEILGMDLTTVHITHLSVNICTTDAPTINIRAYVEQTQGEKIIQILQQYQWEAVKLVQDQGGDSDGL